MLIEPVYKNSPYLETIKRLWRANSWILGFFPDGAFEERASKGQLLIALDEGVCVGYLSYRISTRHQRANIEHVCVDASHRGEGIARKLVDYLKNITQHLYGIRVTCRRDFDANKMWPKFGFAPREEKPGRGHDSQILSIWWYEHQNLPIFELIEQNLLESRYKAALDASVFFDLHTPNGNDESLSLTADWINDEVVLCVTWEIFNEIDRSSDAVNRQRQKRNAESYICLRGQDAVVDQIAIDVIGFFPEGERNLYDSDVRQVAHAIAGGANFFITRDTALLDISGELNDKYDLLITRPSEFIIRLDELYREVEYQPAKLSGSRIEIIRVGSKHEFDLSVFQNSTLRETKAGFFSRLHPLLADPRSNLVRVIIGENGEPIALLGINPYSRQQLDVSFMRVTKNPLISTLAHHLVLQTILYAVKENYGLICIIDPYLSDELIQALQENAFMPSGNLWLKMTLPVVKESAEILDEVKSLGDSLDKSENIIEPLVTRIIEGLSIGSVAVQSEIERWMWPLKIADAKIPTFVVSIHPHWAMELFDADLADQTLFKANPILALNGEHVYYRSARQNILSLPARILWYVTDDAQFHQSKSIRACSVLDEIVVGKPKDLYRRFRRLGVYTWNNVYETADGNVDNEIMALRFSNTEQFIQPIGWDEIRRILLNVDGQNAQFQSPTRISNQAFLALYKLGTGR